MNYFQYAILKKDNNYFALLTNPNTYLELGHYYEQGYGFYMYISAFNANSAIELAKQNENSEISRLQIELNRLRQENQRLRDQNYNGFSNNINNIDPLAVLNFTEIPTQNELKKRFIELSNKFHPDKNGSNFIMQLINEANEQLKK